MINIVVDTKIKEGPVSLRLLPPKRAGKRITEEKIPQEVEGIRTRKNIKVKKELMTPTLPRFLLTKSQNPKEKDKAIKEMRPPKIKLRVKILRNKEIGQKNSNAITNKINHQNIDKALDLGAETLIKEIIRYPPNRNLGQKLIYPNRKELTRKKTTNLNLKIKEIRNIIELVKNLNLRIEPDLRNKKIKENHLNPGLGLDRSPKIIKELKIPFTNHQNIMTI